METQTLATSVLVLLCFSMIKCVVFAQESSSKTFLIEGRMLVLILVLATNAISIYVWYNLTDMSLFLFVSVMISLFFPYFGRTSRHRIYYEGELFRSHNDRLVTTSAIYLCAAAVAVYYRQINIALNCCITFAGSSAYHRYREMAFFNLDNIFATSLLVVFVYTLCSSYYHHEIVFTLGAMGMPVAIFLLAYCGMPAEITLRKVMPSDRLCCIRLGRPLYDAIHNMWHLVSGGGPMLAVWYFDHIGQRGLDGGVELYNPFTQATELVPHLTILPYAALALAIVVNLLGNYYDIMPME